MIKTPKHIFSSFDWLTFTIIFLLSNIGVLFVFSSTYTPEHMFSIFFKKQLIGLAIGAIIYSATFLFSPHTLMRWGYIGYYGVIGLLIFTLIKGSIGMGAQRWINLGFIKLQPSEIAKLLFPAFIAYHFSMRDTKKLYLGDYIPIVIILFLSFILILKQPDLGTALIIMFSGLILLWIAGLPRIFFLTGFLLCIISTPLLWRILKPYQKKRIAVFLGQGESHKERYQIEQALIAIGSGGMTGKGLLRGTQNILQFLPESRTDFIFAVVCEEWGFLGALFILLLYAILFARLLWQIMYLSNLPTMLLALGLLIHIILSALINICMVVGLLPIVGIPLPLMSYGLSNLWISLISFAWLQNILMHQRYIKLYK